MYNKTTEYKDNKKRSTLLTLTSGWTPLKLFAHRKSLMGNPGDFFIRLCKITQVAGIVQIRPFYQMPCECQGRIAAREIVYIILNSDTIPWVVF